jgi:hypothetical protein
LYNDMQIDVVGNEFEVRHNSAIERLLAQLRLIYSSRSTDAATQDTRCNAFPFCKSTNLHCQTLRCKMTAQK